MSFGGSQDEVRVVIVGEDRAGTSEDMHMATSAASVLATVTDADHTMIAPFLAEHAADVDLSIAVAGHRLAEAGWRRLGERGRELAAERDRLARAIGVSAQGDYAGAVDAAVRVVAEEALLPRALEVAARHRVGAHLALLAAVREAALRGGRFDVAAAAAALVEERHGVRDLTDRDARRRAAAEAGELVRP